MAPERATPSITALFRVVFDQKVGYTFTWSCAQNADGTPTSDQDKKRLLDGVEYKSLPSGLHEVSEDVIYFVHSPKDTNERYAGVSYFARAEADAAQRNASFTSVGALISLDERGDQLGKAWELVDRLRALSKALTEDDTEDARAAFDQTWSELRDRQTSVEAEADDLSEGISGGLVHHNHPSLSMSTMLEMFGPLIFPLYRATLLRQRILIVDSPPVLPNNEYCAILGSLAALPPEIRGIVAHFGRQQLTTPSALCSVGVHDLAELDRLGEDKDTLPTGWAATTTDTILASKMGLFDMCVRMPSCPGTPKIRQESKWPHIFMPNERVLKATRRDLRRYQLLQHQLQTVAHDLTDFSRDDVDDDQDYDEREPLMEREPRVPGAFHSGEWYERPRKNLRQIVERRSWSQATQRSLAWFTSASDMSSYEQNLTELERCSLPTEVSSGLAPREILGDELLVTQWQRQELAGLITTYFQQQTIQCFKTLHNLAQIDPDHRDEQRDDRDGSRVVTLTSEDLTNLGLDYESRADQDWAISMFRKWTGLSAEIEKSTWDLCGLRMC